MGLFTKHFYHKTTRTYTAVLTAIMSELQVNTENKLVQIPITPLGGTRDKPDGISPTNGVYPRGTLAFVGYVPEDERQLSNNQHRHRTSDNTSTQLMRMPMGYQFRVAYRFKKADEAYQVIEQVVPAFSPSLDFRWEDNADLGNHQNLKVKLDSFEIDDNWEGDSEEPDYHDVSFTFTLSGHLYRRTSKTSSIINSVDIDLAVFPDLMNAIPLDHTDRTHKWIEVKS
ncbi:hypothetical protein MYOV003v1_p0135 [Vibrio phage 207E48.1]|nr:hypothetical protein MYOV003v1_p0135 [Vibrio phage 207E48.1]